MSHQCANCGKEVQQEWPKCPFCNQPNSSFSEPKPVGTRWVVVVSAAVAIFIAVAVSLSYGAKRKEAAAIEAIDSAADACISNNKYVYTDRIVKAKSLIRQNFSDATEQATWNLKLSSRLKVLGCPI
ncbi:MAG TPA: hypothetical protein VKZ53_13020 [Candidatus Angelobacter sp.]|nr:hypothetical protein [Candidatus Angelobacter sp.]